MEENTQITPEYNTQDLNQGDNKTETCHCKNYCKQIIGLYVLTGLLLIITAVLFYKLHKHTCSTNNSQSLPILNTNGQIIAFFDRDSLMHKFEMVKELKDKLEESRTKMENSFAAKQKAFENEALQFQEKVQKGGFLTQESAEKEQQRLLEKQQKLYELNQSLSEQLADQELELTITLHDTISKQLIKFNEEKGYAYIMSYAKGGDIFYANPRYDITNELIDLLNNHYKKHKAKK